MFGMPDFDPFPTVEEIDPLPKKRRIPRPTAVHLTYVLLAAATIAKVISTSPQAQRRYEVPLKNVHGDVLGTLNLKTGRTQTK